MNSSIIPALLNKFEFSPRPQTERFFEFDEIEIVNNRPMNIWLYAKCRRYIDPYKPEAAQVTDGEVQVAGKYD